MIASSPPPWFCNISRAASVASFCVRCTLDGGQASGPKTRFCPSSGLCAKRGVSNPKSNFTFQDVSGLLGMQNGKWRARGEKLRTLSSRCWQSGISTLRRLNPSRLPELPTSEAHHVVELLAFASCRFHHARLRSTGCSCSPGCVRHLVQERGHLFFPATYQRRRGSRGPEPTTTTSPRSASAARRCWMARVERPACAAIPAVERPPTVPM